VQAKEARAAQAKEAAEEARARESWQEILQTDDRFASLSTQRQGAATQPALEHMSAEIEVASGRTPTWDAPPPAPEGQESLTVQERPWGPLLLSGRRTPQKFWFPLPHRHLSGRQALQLRHSLLPDNRAQH
jgi:hypothetical protein